MSQALSMHEHVTDTVMVLYVAHAKNVVQYVPKKMAKKQRLTINISFKLNLRIKSTKQIDN